MKVPFDTIWEIENGKIKTNKISFVIGGFTAHKNALQDFNGMFGGITWNDFIGRELEITERDNTTIIIGIH